MSRHSLTVKCAFDGCKEYGHYDYANKKDYHEGSKRHANWECTRHKYPESVLTVLNTTKETILICVESNGHNYWAEKEKHLSGFQFGNGYKAWASDFPIGTQLIVTARIIAEG